MLSPQLIPGMIEEIEQALLLRLAASDFIAASDCVVEFGAFFGRSTACLVNGVVSRHQNLAQAPTIFVFDSFSCAKSDGFSAIVHGFAAQGGVEHILRLDQGRLNFRPAFDHYTAVAQQAGILKATTSELADAVAPQRSIALMHIDAPKFYQEFRYVLMRFFPHLKVGARIVFQDYFYHWSATLIAACQILHQMGCIAFEASAASSLVARVLRVPSLPELVEMDLRMQSAPIETLIDQSIAATKPLPIDRPDQFLPRLYLAKLQHAWEREGYKDARAAFERMLSDFGGKVHGNVLQDFLELMSHGFSIRRLYERDH